MSNSTFRIVYTGAALAVVGGALYLTGAEYTKVCSLLALVVALDTRATMAWNTSVVSKYLDEVKDKKNE